jgi:hypothetical protein
MNLDSRHATAVLLAALACACGSDSATGASTSGAPSGSSRGKTSATGSASGTGVTSGSSGAAASEPASSGGSSTSVASSPSGGASGTSTSGSRSASSASGMRSSSATSSSSSGSGAVADAGAVAGPCDLYQAGGTPCVAAFSTVRALYGSYAGNLYQVTRADNATQNIGVLSPGGVADAAAQDAFCAGASCTISILYDQSPKGNHLTRAPKGTNNQTGAQDSLAVANALPITIGGHKAYGLHSPPHTGYRNNATQGVATGDSPEVIYEVSDGTYNPQGCCFDFGNAETTNAAGGQGEMEALLFGKAFWDTGAGAGPWVLCDMEVGVYNHGGATGNGRQGNYPNEPSMAFPFVTAMIKGNSANGTGGGPFTVKGSNAQSGTLSTWYDGARPQGYSPMRKHGAILLGIGGDDSNTGGGNFYEGVMTAGYSTDATDNAVQANIVAAVYGK